MFALEGARGITITYLPEEEEDATEAARDIEAAGAKVVTVKCDLEQHDDCKRVVDEHLKAFGTINVLVNNASKQMYVLAITTKLILMFSCSESAKSWRKSTSTTSAAPSDRTSCRYANSSFI
jgi:NAD(P)-dependent dehydrogenase (short-subunit alcohol dehydrogenase family)